MDIIDSILEEFDRFGFTPHQYPNPIGMFLDDQKSLIYFALSAPQGNFIEFGSFAGGSAVLLSLVQRKKGNGKVFSVDSNFNHCNKAFDRNLYKVGKFQDISIKVECFSQELFLVRDRYKIQDISLVLIDDWHSFKACIQNFRQIEPFLLENAIVCFHDCSPYPHTNEKIKQNYKWAKENYEEMMQEKIPKITPLTKEEYHRLEQNQNFRIDEAVAFIIKEYNYEIVELPTKYCSGFYPQAGTTYVKGRTSPFNSLIGIRKKK